MMNLENFVVRFVGLMTACGSVFWWWKINDFTFAQIGGVPIPVQIFLSAAGILMLLVPGFFFRTVSVMLLPKEKNAQLTNLINGYFPTKKEVEIKASDSDLVLAEKINRAIYQSRRRFYIAVFVALVLVPMLIYFGFRFNNSSQSRIRGSGEQLLTAVQNTRLVFKSRDEFHALLETTKKDITSLKASESSLRRIYDIIEELYGDESMDSDDALLAKFRQVYEREIGSKFESGPFDIHKIDAPDSSFDPPYAKQTLYILLIIVCDKEGDNGRFVVPHFYGRGLLNNVLNYSPQGVPTIVSNLDAVNYANLLKSKQGQDFDRYLDIAKSVFGEKVPDFMNLAMLAKTSLEKHKALDTSNRARLRYLNNDVDLYLTCIYLIRIRGEKFTPGDQTASGFLAEITTSDLTPKFSELLKRLDQAGKFEADPVLETTKAQLFALEGEVNEHDQTAKGRNPVWCKEQRERALAAIKTAILLHQPRETFSGDQAETFYLSWLWKDSETVRELKQLSSI